MKTKVALLKKILDRLSETTGFSQDFSGFQSMTEEIGLGNSHYLYKKVYQPIIHRQDKDMIGLSRFHLNKIAGYLGFKSFAELESDLSNTLSPQLASLAGSYYCYVRANLPTGQVFRSPVRISIQNNKAVFELSGPMQKYRGEVSLKKGCLFILMTSKEGKAFYHIYKCGTRQRPDVLQGVFSGVSTAFDPIGGRTVLIRQVERFDELKTAKTKVVVLKRSRRPDEKAIGRYFEKYENNNVVPGRAVTFTIDDL